jgi:hypothetical protein
LEISGLGMVPVFPSKKVLNKYPKAAWKKKARELGLEQCLYHKYTIFVLVSVSVSGIVFMRN